MLQFEIWGRIWGIWGMKTVKVTLTGTMPMLMHADNIAWADMMEEWKNDPNNKALSKAGDDRTPPWRWIGCLNYDDPKTGVVTVPSEYIMSSILGGAAEVPTGKGKKTFKSQSQSGLLIAAFHWPLLVKGQTIAMSDVNDMRELKLFREHCEAAEVLGFSLFMKRAKIGNAKHVRVRPRFDNWSCTGEITILDDQITEKILGQFLSIAGRAKGLGDWRPGSQRPGPFGTFEAKVQ